MIGKNFSRNNASGKRHASDLYETHYPLTRMFLDATNELWDSHRIISYPCAGNGAIIKVLRERNFTHIVKHDILTDGVDFLTDDTRVDYIITNPPFLKSNDFILHAKEVCDRFAFLLPLTYLQGSFRYHKIWTDNIFRLRSIHVFDRFPMLGVPLRADGLMPTGMQALAWFTWDKKYSGASMINWLDIDRYILHTKKSKESLV
jgi:hypothetical protein